MSRTPSSVAERVKQFQDEAAKQSDELVRAKQLKLRSAESGEVALWKQKWGLGGERDGTDVGETQARRLDELEQGKLPPKSPPQLPPQGKTPPPILPSGPGIGMPKPPTTPKKAPPPKDDYVSKAFKNGIVADMFHLPEGMSRKQLEDLCLQFNFVMKQFVDTQEVRMQELAASGMPLAGKRKTGEVDATQLKRMIDLLWDKKEIAGGIKPEVPSADKIRQDAIGWCASTAVDQIKQYRATEIANVKVAGPKSAFVTSESLETANKQLAEVGSFLRLIPAGPPDEHGFVPIRPEWNPGQKVTADHAESHAKLLQLNQERQAASVGSLPVDKEHLYVSWADCHRTAQSIMGSEDTASGIQDTEHVVIPSPSGGTTIAPIGKQIIKTIPNASDHGTNRAMHALFNETMPAFKKQLIEEAGGVDKLGKEAKEVVDQIDEALRIKGDNPANFRAAYKTIYQNPELNAKYSAANGVNSSVKPKVGDALAQINDEYEKANAPEGTDLWNFHFAGVVLANADGSYMTLENLSVEDSNAVNDDWYFAIYDPNQGKDFHTVNAKDSHVGTRPITMLIRKT